MKKNKISKNWVNKQRRDIYVRQSKVDGYRARSAYKLIEIDEKYKIFKGGLTVIDIGAAPGSWSQYAEKKAKNGKLISIDLKKMEPIGSSIQIQGDFTEENVQEEIKKNTISKVDVVMSDMAAASSGHKQTDHLRIVALCEAAAELAFDVLSEGGTFVAKVLAGGAEGALQQELKKRFTKVANFKPGASRSDSSEKFVVALGFKG